MEGLSHTKRLLYISLLSAIFVIGVPILVLYTSGYRLSEDFSIIKTGGVFVDVPRAGASFFLNDEPQGVGTFFQRDFFGQNLTPSSYVVRIEQEGFHGWRKEMVVLPQLITSGRALMLPEEPSFAEVPEFLDTATGTPRTINPEYRELISFFSATTTNTRSVATSTLVYAGATTTIYERGNIGLSEGTDGLRAHWLGLIDEIPYFFCDPEICKSVIVVAGRESGFRYFDFFLEENVFVVIEWPDGIFVTELDTRPPQNIQPLYESAGARFRIIDDSVYVLDRRTLLRLEQ